MKTTHSATVLTSWVSHGNLL